MAQSKRRRMVRVLAQLVLASVGTLMSTFSGASELSMADKKTAEVAEHVNFLNEFRARRISTVHVPLARSIFDGQQVGYVHTSSGALGLVRRDIVLRGPLTVSIGRLYFSDKLSRQTDFGKNGWRLSIAESILSTSQDTLVYVTETGDEIGLLRTDAGIEIAKPRPTDIVRISHIDGDRIKIELKTGIDKYFDKYDDRYLLAQVVGPDKNRVGLEYAEGALVAVSTSSGQKLRFERDSDSRLQKAQTNDGRIVSYEYADSGNLVAVSDLSGRIWRYFYDRDNRLAWAEDPRRQEDIRIRYDSKNRAIETVSRSSYRTTYAYRRRHTDVKLPGGRQLTFKATQDGITAAVRSSDGTFSSLTFDEFNSPSRVVLSGSPSMKIRRSTPNGPDHIRFDDVDGFSSSIAIRRNDRNQVVSAVHSDRGTVFSARYGDMGLAYAVSGGNTLERRNSHDSTRSTTLVLDGERTTITTNSNAAPVRVSTANAVTWTVAYNEQQRPTVSFDPDLGTSKYTYNSLGFRRSHELGNGARVSYRYDDRGAVESVRINYDQNHSASQQYEVDDSSSVIAMTDSEGNKLSLLYNDSGNVSTASTRETIVRYSYDQLGRLSTIDDSAWDEPIFISYVSGEPDMRDMHDAGMDVIHGATIDSGISFASPELAWFGRSMHAPTFPLRWNDGLGRYELVSEFGETDTLDTYTSAYRRARLITGSEDVLARSMAFESQSNSLFVPTEYWAANCCIDECPIFPFSCPCYGQTLLLSTGQSSVRPTGAGAPASTSVTAQTLPFLIGWNIDFSVTPIANSGGHPASTHSSGRPKGSFAQTTVTTGITGTASTIWTAPIFGGTYRLIATLQTFYPIDDFRNIDAKVPNLAGLGTGQYYTLTGATNLHPSGNHSAVSSLLSAMQPIANDYHNQFYSGTTQPTSEYLRYNDASLPFGGKFELGSGWCSFCSHSEHRVGTNIDVGAAVEKAMPDWAVRKLELENIFANNGSTSINDETHLAQGPHWHVRF